MFKYLSVATLPQFTDFGSVSDDRIEPSIAFQECHCGESVLCTS